MRSQQGFSIVELLVIIVVVAIIGVAGVRIMGSRDKAVTPNSTASSATTKSDVSTAPAVTDSSDLTAAQQTLDQNDPTSTNAADSSQLDSDLADLN